MLLRFCLLAVASAALLRAQSTVLDETFTSGDRSTQNPPGSLAWYVAGASTNLAVRNGALDVASNNTQRDMWAYFPTVSLNIGDSLTLALDFSFTTTPAQVASGFRFALGYTNGVAPTRTNGAAPTGNYQGYGSFTDPTRATGATRIRKRNGPAAINPTGAFLEVNDGGSASWLDVAPQTALAGPAQANVPYTATLKITRIAADLAVITTSFSGGALGDNNTFTVTDAGAFTIFDTLALDLQGGVLAGDVLITRVRLTNDVGPTARLINLSILTTIPASGDSFTLGYVVGGSGASGTKPLVVRAAGPSLGAIGVPGTLDDPKLELFSGTTKIGENDNWGGGADLRDAMAGVGAFAFASATSRDAAALTSLSAGASNTLRVSANGSGTGAVIAEIYDAEHSAPFSASTPRLVNLSVLKHLGSGLTVGFVISGSGTKTVLVRAIGPSLAAAPFNVTGVVADPQLAVFNRSTQVAANDNWGGDATLTAAFIQVGAFALPATSRDAAVLTTLAPGNDTVQVSGVGGTTGVALVEVYEVQ